jgi:hypothetical protein
MRWGVLLGLLIVGTVIGAVGLFASALDHSSSQAGSESDSPRATMALPPRPNPIAISTISAIATAFVATPTPMPKLSDLATGPTRSFRGTPTATPAAPLLLTVLDEQFVDNQRDWPDNQDSTAWLTGGGYHLFARKPGNFVAIRAPLREPIGDVAVQAVFSKVGGPPGGGYGLIVSDQSPGQPDGLSQDGQFMVLEVGDRGEFGVWLRDGNRWIDVIPWTQTDVVHTGLSANQLTVAVSGPVVSFFANGNLLVGRIQTSLGQGAVGVFVGGDLNQVVLQRFTVHVPG